MSELPRPTEFELAILRVIWRSGAATVRHVFEELKLERQLGYNTVLKTMLILLDKGLVVRDASQRSHIYRPAMKEQETQADLLRDLLHRAFGGSAKKLVLAAINEAPLSPEDAAEIKDFSVLRSRSTAPKDLRGTRRHPCERRVQVWTQDRKASLALAVNISQGGLLLGAFPAVPVGVPCEVALGPGGAPGVTAKGLIVRSDERGTAIRFLATLDAEQFENIIYSE